MPPTQHLLALSTLPSCAGASASVVVCCPICAGRGFQVSQRCACCGGGGLTQQPRSVPVSVPPGVEDGSLLRVPHEGGVTRAGGPRGTVVLEVQVGAVGLY